MKTLIFLILALLFLISASITSFIVYTDSLDLNYWGNESQSRNLWLHPENKNLTGFYETYSINGKIFSIENNNDEDSENFTLQVTVTDPNGSSFQKIELPEIPASSIFYYKTDSTNTTISKEQFLGSLQLNDFIQVVMQKKLGDDHFSPKLIEIYEAN